MKIICFARSTYIIISLLVTCAGCSTHAQELYKFQTVKVSEGIYQLVSSEVNGDWVTGNTTVIINEKDVMIVDAGFLPSVARQAIAEIKKLTNKPVKYLVNTHWHGDHWQGNSAFKEAYPDVRIIASEEALRGMQTKGMFWLKKNYIKLFEDNIAQREKVLATGIDTKGKKISDEEKEKIKRQVSFNNAEVEEIRHIQPLFPDLTFTKELLIRSGSREIQLHYFGWGNTTGDAVIYLPQEKILITGDLVVSPSPYESGSFSTEWLNVFKKLKEFSFTTLLPGHGTVEHDSNYLDFLIALFEEIIREVNPPVLEGKTLEETQKIVTHQTVTQALSKRPVLTPFIKDLDPHFVEAALLRAYPKAKEGKL